MVRTNDSPAVAGTDEQRVRSMAAYIIEGAQCPALIANDQNALVKDLAHVVIAGVGEVRCVALIRPRSEENGLLLPVEHFRFVVPPGGERGGAGRIFFEAANFESCRRGIIDRIDGHGLSRVCFSGAAKRI